MAKTPQKRAVSPTPTSKKQSNSDSIKHKLKTQQKGSPKKKQNTQIVDLTKKTKAMAVKHHSKSQVMEVEYPEVEVKREKLEQEGYVTPESKVNPEKANQDIIQILISHKLEELMSKSEKEKKKYIKQYYILEGMNITSIHTMDKSMLDMEIEEIHEVATKKWEYAQYKKKSEQEILKNQEMVQQMHLHRNVSEEDLNEYDNNVLRMYIHMMMTKHRETGKIPDLAHKPRNELIQIVQEYVKRKLPDAVTWEETEKYIMSEKLDDLETTDLDTLKMHAVNWYEYAKSSPTIIEFDKEYIIAEFEHARRKLSKGWKPKGSKTEEVEDEDFTEEDLYGSDEILIITAETTNDEISNLDRDQAQEVYSNYLESNNLHKDSKKLKESSFETLISNITMIRNTMIKRSKELAPILEDKGQEEIELMIDTPDITAELLDSEIEEMDSELLAKTYYKCIKKEGVPAKITNFLLWSPDALKNSIRRKRDQIKRTQALFSEVVLHKYL